MNYTLIIYLLNPDIKKSCTQDLLTIPQIFRSSNLKVELYLREDQSSNAKYT